MRWMEALLALLASPLAAQVVDWLRDFFNRPGTPPLSGLRPDQRAELYQAALVHVVEKAANGGSQPLTSTPPTPQQKVSK